MTLTSHEIDTLGWQIWQAELHDQFRHLEPNILKHEFKWVFYYGFDIPSQELGRFGVHVYLNDWMAEMHDPVENPQFGMGFGGTMGSTEWIAFKNDADAIVFKMAYGSATQWDNPT